MVELDKEKDNEVESVIFDDRDGAWPAYSPDLQRRLGNSQKDFDFPAYAVRNLGFVRADFQEAGARIFLRPKVLATNALTTAFYDMAMRGTQRIVVSHFCEEEDDIPAPAGPWMDELYGDLGIAYRRVEDLATAAGRLPKLPDYMDVRRPIEEIDRVASGRLAIVLQRWAEAHAILHPELVDQLIRDKRLERFLVVRREPHTQKMVFDFASDGYGTAKYWGKFVIGQDVEALPDREYGRRLAQTYHAVDDEDEPRLDCVDVTLHLSETEIHRACYERLVLPWLSPAGDRLIMSTSILRGSFRRK